MHKYGLLLLCYLWVGSLQGQALEIGMETTFGPAASSFKGDLSEMFGIKEIEISTAEIDTAFSRFNIDAPRWLKELFPGLRIEVDGEVARQLTRNNNAVRFYAKLKWIGGSFTISDPRLAEPLEARKLKNQIKSIRLSLAGKPDELATHLGEIALADATKVKPFFNKRYDLEGYVHLKQVLMGDELLAEWGKNNTLDWELTSGIRLTADPSPVVDLGNVLFIREKLDSLMEGGILRPVEKTTDKIAEAVQNVVFGKFRDPRVVPQMGWFGRGQLLANFGGSFSFVLGAELSVNEHLTMSGTRPVWSVYGFTGLRFHAFRGERKNTSNARRRRK